MKSDGISMLRPFVGARVERVAKSVAKMKKGVLILRGKAMSKTVSANVAAMALGLCLCNGALAGEGLSVRGTPPLWEPSLSAASDFPARLPTDFKSLFSEQAPAVGISCSGGVGLRVPKEAFQVGFGTMAPIFHEQLRIVFGEGSEGPFSGLSMKGEPSPWRLPQSLLISPQAFAAPPLPAVFCK